MTYDEVTDIVGGSGYRVSTGTNDFFGNREVYEYSSPYRPLTTAKIYLVFINGELKHTELNGNFY
ncbi:hypothetical protein D3C78_1829350 [compost metagenome]